MKTNLSESREIPLVVFVWVMTRKVSAGDVGDPFGLHTNESAGIVAHCRVEILLIRSVLGGGMSLCPTTSDMSNPDPQRDADQWSPPTSSAERWRRKFGVITGLGTTDQDRKYFGQEYCDKTKQELMTTSTR